MDFIKKSEKLNKCLLVLAFIFSSIFLVINLFFINIRISS